MESTTKDTTALDRLANGLFTFLGVTVVTSLIAKVTVNPANPLPLIGAAALLGLVAGTIVSVTTKGKN